MIIRQNKKEKDFELFDYKEPEKIEIVQEDPLPDEKNEEKKINKNIFLIIGGVLLIIIIIILAIVLSKGKKYTLNIDSNQIFYINKNNTIEAEVIGKNVKNINANVKVNNSDILNYVDLEINGNIVNMSFNGVKEGSTNVNIELSVNNKKVRKNIKAHVCKQLTEASFSSDVIYVQENASVKLPLYVGSSSYCVSDVKYESNNDSVSNIEKGVLKSGQSGEAEINIKQNDFTYTLKVVVSNSFNKIKEIKTDSDNISLLENEEYKIPIDLGDSSSKYLIFESSNPNVISVNQKGVVKAIGNGSAIITISSTDGSNLSKKITVNVSKYRNANNIKLNNEKIELYTGNTTKLEYTVEPSNSEYSSVKFSSENEKVASVNNEGVITGISEGSTKVTITVVNKDNTKVSKTVGIVIKKAQSETSTPNPTPDPTPTPDPQPQEYVNAKQILFGKHFLSVGKSYPLCYRILPIDANIKDIKFEILSAKDAATIDSKGIITTKKGNGADPQIKVTITNMDGSTIYNVTRIKIYNDESLYRPCDDSEQEYKK